MSDRTIIEISIDAARASVQTPAPAPEAATEAAPKGKAKKGKKAATAEAPLELL